MNGERGEIRRSEGLCKTKQQGFIRHEGGLWRCGAGKGGGKSHGGSEGEGCVGAFLQAPARALRSRGRPWR